MLVEYTEIAILISSDDTVKLMIPEEKKAIEVEVSFCNGGAELFEVSSEADPRDDGLKP